MGESRLLLVRHGESLANAARVLQGHSQGALTPAGRDASARLARSLAVLPVTERPSAVFSSDLRRAEETAEIIALALQLTTVALPAAREWNVGVLDGLPAAALQEAAATAGQMVWEYAPPGGESLSGVRIRASALLLEFAATAARAQRTALSTRTLLISHGDFIRMALSVAASMPIERAVEIALANTSVTELVLEGTVWRVERIGDVQHLAGAGS